MDQYKYNKYLYKIQKMKGGICSYLNSDERNMDYVKNAIGMEFVCVKNTLLGNYEYTCETSNELQKISINYETTRPIGQGSYGSVYPAIMTIIDKNTAIETEKNIIIKRYKIQSHRESFLFCGEIIALSLLNHPVIMKYYGYAQFKFTSEYHLIIEKIEGYELRSYIKKNIQNLPFFHIGAKFNIMINLIIGLQYMHSQQVYHKDIKAANIMITIENGIFVPKYIDFGFSCAKNLCDKHKPMGTPYHMSPQLLDNFKTSEIMYHDIWALGTTLLEMFTSKHFMSKNDYDTKYAGLDQKRITETLNSLFNEQKKIYFNMNSILDVTNYFINNMMQINVSQRRLPTISELELLIHDLDIAGVTGIKLLAPLQQIEQSQQSNLPPRQRRPTNPLQQ
jgi:serine/threonine protein kinase